MTINGSLDKGDGQKLMKILSSIYHWLCKILLSVVPAVSTRQESKPPESSVGQTQQKPSKTSSQPKMASICYSIEEDGSVSIDVAMEDCSESVVEAFSLLFASIPSVQFQVQAMEILQDAFEKDDKHEEFQQFVRGAIIKSKSIQENFRAGKEDKEKSANDPVIKPTDLL